MEEEAERKEDEVFDVPEHEQHEYPIYKAPLHPNETRYICFTPSKEKASPIHVTLEAYPDDDCPEYETVSYTWATEDGEVELSELLYIGPFWDALPQTRNCWTLLRYLRPERGLRLVWVDAICINQDSVFEKTTQVAKMGSIYRNCMRVIVWLGEDIVGECSTRVRPRHSFSDRAKQIQKDDLKEIFRRR